VSITENNAQESIAVWPPPCWTLQRDSDCIRDFMRSRDNVSADVSQRSSAGFATACAATHKS